MSEYNKRQRHHRRPLCHRCHRGRAWRDGFDAEQSAPGSSFQRRFATRDERIARLGTYLGQLRAEAEAVEEHIAELKAASNS